MLIRWKQPTYFKLSRKKKSIPTGGLGSRLCLEEGLALVCVLIASCLFWSWKALCLNCKFLLLYLSSGFYWGRCLHSFLLSFWNVLIIHSFFLFLFFSTPLGFWLKYNISLMGSLLVGLVVKWFIWFYDEAQPESFFFSIELMSGMDEGEEALVIRSMNLMGSVLMIMRRPLLGMKMFL